MHHRLDRRSLLLSALAVAAPVPMAAWAVEPPQRSLRPRARPDDLAETWEIRSLLARMRFQGQISCAAVVLPKSGVSGPAEGKLRPLAGFHSDLSLPPASVAKALTAGYALETLGADHRFQTRLVATGGIMDGVILGDLVIVGGGDPGLDSDALAGLVAALKARGITRVRGRFGYWAGALPRLPQIDDQQPQHVAYNPALGGLNLNYNRVIFEWKREAQGYAVSLQARSAAHRADVDLARMQIVDRGQPVYTYAQDHGRDQWTVAQGALGKGGARALPVRRPALYAAEVFGTLAEGEGIALGKPQEWDGAPRGGFEIARHESAPLDSVLRGMLRYSNNLVAEISGLSASANLGKTPRSLGRSAGAMNDWASAKLGHDKAQLVDHSGLGDQSRIDAQTMVEALVALRQTPGYKPLLHDYPMRDAQRRIIRDHPVTLKAKTGTLNFVSSLAGFADLPDGREIAFAIFTADLEKRAALRPEQRENPPGGKGWNGVSRRVQQALIDLWVKKAA